MVAYPTAFPRAKKPKPAPMAANICVEYLILIEE